jgi:hypothetical protein
MQGAAHGIPLVPIPNDIDLHKLNEPLEGRGLKLVRNADDLNIFMKSGTVAVPEWRRKWRWQRCS